MSLPKTAKYQAYDIDVEEVGFLMEVMSMLGLQNQVSVDTGDILSDSFEYADVVFLFKLLPCLEHQAKNYIEIVLKQMCKFLVISYPIRSLSGKSRGMKDFYTREFRRQFAEYKGNIKQLLFPTEAVFIIEK
ncbi:MAG: hypothetical protein ABIE03_03095 [Patescibacteria group bacterium]|nr:hypothetical protein [Patescibacteria group bacterium]